MKPIVALFISLLLWGCSANKEIELAPIDAPLKCFNDDVFKKKTCYYESAPDEGQSTILLIHGIASNATQTWSNVWTPLSQKYRLLAIDLPGHGTSLADFPNEFSPGNYAKSIKQLINFSVSGPLFVVGHSMGGNIALRYVTTYPDDVEKLVLIDAAGILHRFAFTKFLIGARVDNVGERWESRGGFSNVVTKLMEEVEEGVTRIGDDEKNQLVGRFTSVKDAAAFYTAEESFAGSLESLTLPSLIIWGEQDNIAPVRTARVLANRLPYASLHLMANTGHSPNREKPSELIEIIAPFLDQNDAPQNENNDKYDSASNKENDAVSNEQEREGICLNKRGKVFQGQYKSIDIQHCDKVVLANIETTSLSIFESRVIIENSVIENKKPGAAALSLTGSEVYVDNSRIVGAVPVHVNRSRLDMAGVDLQIVASQPNAQEEAVQSSGTSSTVVISLGSIIPADEENGRAQVPLHGFWTLVNGMGIPGNDTGK